MATKISILGEEPTEKKKLKPIEAIACIQAGKNGDLYYSDYSLTKNNELKIIKVNYSAYPFDCIIINDDGAIFIGHFNDGIV